MINLIKLRSPDFRIGRILFLTKALADILLWLIRQPSKRAFYLARLLLQVKPKYTMVSVKRLINLYELVQRVNGTDLPGDIVECGVWNGGSAAIMGVACQDDRKHWRTFWLFDSFCWTYLHRAVRTVNALKTPILKAGVTEGLKR